MDVYGYYANVGCMVCDCNVRKNYALLFAHSSETKIGLFFGFTWLLKTKPKSALRKHHNVKYFTCRANDDPTGRLIFYAQQVEDDYIVTLF